MRRLIAYITMAAAMVFAVGVSSTPVLTKLHEGREFSSGREIVFKIEKEEGDLPSSAADEVAAIMRTRLDNYPVEDYSVKVQDSDTVVASFDVDESEFNYVAKYLSFSGKNFTFSAEKETSFKTGHDILKVDEAKIEYKTEAKYPIITIPVTDQGKTDIKDIIKELKPETKAAPKRAGETPEGEGEGETQKQDLIYLWANYEEGDSIEDAQHDPVMQEKIIMKFDINNIWYPDEKNPETKIQYTCATADESGQLNLSGLKDFNIQSDYLLNMLTAEKYDYKVSCPTVNIDGASMSVDYLANSTIVEPTAEKLITLGSNISINYKSKTFIATVVTIGVLGLLLGLYYRMSAIGMFATTLSTTFLTLVAANKMNVLFNVPTIIGLMLLASVLLFGEIAYVNRFKEEVYKGRTIKKANQEAARRTNLIIADAAFVSVFSGLMMYALGGSALKPMGVILFFGGVFSLIANLLVFRLLMHLLTNSTNLQSKYGAFNIDGKRVPNLMSTVEKEPYVSPLEKVNFTKHRKPISIVFGALSLAAITIMAVFGAVNKSPLNVKDAIADTTVVYTSIEINTKNPIIGDEASFKEYALKGIDIEGAGKVEVKNVTQYEYNHGEEKTHEIYYFEMKSNRAFSEEERLNYENSITDNIETALGGSEYTLSVEVKNSKELIYTPRQGLVILATGISIVGVALYACLRYRPSRGISLFASTVGATAISYGIFVGIRVGTTAVTSLVIPFVAVSMMLASLFYLSTEKTMRKEHHEDLTKEVRNEIMVKALGKAAVPSLLFLGCVLYIAIAFFAFSVPQTLMLFGASILGVVIAAFVLFTVLGPLAELIALGFSKIHLPKLKIFEKKEKAKTVVKHSSSEPEETIFIGIND